MKIFLYAILGVVLQQSGVDVIEAPVNFIAIMFCVVGIDILSASQAQS